MDWTAALAHTGDDAELLAELAAMFVEDFPRVADEARAALAQGDMGTLTRSAHTLKGRMAFFGFDDIREQAAALEEMGNRMETSGAAADPGVVESALETLLRATDGVLPEFRALARLPPGSPGRAPGSGSTN